LARIEIRRFSRVKTCLGQVFVHASLIGAARAAALPPQSAAFKGRTAARPESEIISRTSSCLSTPVHVSVDELEPRIAVENSAHRLTSIRFGPNAVALEHASPHAIEIGPADLGERQKRIGIGALGQCLFRELPELDTRPQCNLHNGSEHGLRSTHNIMRGE
jgi:hypothetical protein